MKYIYLLATLLSLNSFAQIELNFNSRFVECEDQWVAFPMNKDSSYIFGFIYIDEQAGLTFNKEGYFNFNSNNIIKAEKTNDVNFKFRLQANQTKVAIIPKSMYQDLNIKQKPDWLKMYKTDTISAKHFFDWGYMYNGWNECSKALIFLERAKKIEPNYQGLNVELAFSYNCLNNFEEAEKILIEDIKTNPSNAYTNKEYIYTLTKNNKIELACSQFVKSLTTIKDTQYNAENCYNILQFYYHIKDKPNFDKWYIELKKWPITNQHIINYTNEMKAEMEK